MPQTRKGPGPKLGGYYYRNIAMQMLGYTLDICYEDLTKKQRREINHQAKSLERRKTSYQT